MTLTLLQVARRLQNARLDRAVAQFREPSVAIRRIALLAVTVVWVAFWREKISNEVLSAEARAVLPTVVAFLVISIAWAVLVRRRADIQDKEWVDIAGTSADFLGIAVIMTQAFNLLLPYVIFLPLVCITTGARYDQRIFLLAIVAALLIVGVSAPPGYWESRPVVAVLALALVGGLPLTVNRLLNGLRVMSEQAIVMSEQAISASQDALRASDARSRFLATMSHELRTPLNTVVHAATLIDASGLPPEDRRLIELLETSAHVLLHRVNDVLDLAASEAGSLHVAPDPFYIAQVFARLEKVVAHRAESKHISLQLHGVDTVPQAVLGDSDRVEQVLTNLTSNALKYTQQGGAVSIAVHHAPSDDPSRLSVVFTVTDNGIGISDSDKPLVFDAFRKVGTHRRQEGVGLGLHIAKAISHCLGGEFDPPRDNPGGGTIFSWRVSFDVCPSSIVVPPPMSALDALAAHRQRVAPMRCLVVDDQETNRAVFKRLLERAGHQPSFADDGERGLQALALGGIDVVFLDLQMPGMSGFEFLEAARDGEHAAPPIVVVSATAERDQVAKAMHLGAMAYLPKPIATQKVLDVIERVQHASRAQQRAVGEA